MQSKEGSYRGDSLSSFPIGPTCKVPSVHLRLQIAELRERRSNHYTIPALLIALSIKKALKGAIVLLRHFSEVAL